MMSFVLLFVYRGGMKADIDDDRFTDKLNESAINHLVSKFAAAAVLLTTC